MAESDERMYAQIHGRNAIVNFKVMPDEVQYVFRHIGGMTGGERSTGA